MYKKTFCKEDRILFAKKMAEIEIFCKENGIYQSRSGDSYYFTIKGTNYRVSNHTSAASDARAFNERGEQVRDFYHSGNDNRIEILASKTRIIEIYNNLLAGKILDKRGNLQ